MNSGIGFLLRVTDSVTRVALALSDGDNGCLMEWFEFMGYDQAVGWSPTNIPYPLVVPWQRFSVPEHQVPRGGG